MHVIQRFMIAEAASFVIAACMHSGVPITGYEHATARIAESVLATILIAALLLTWLHPQRTRTIGIAAQSFALLGTLVGAFTIIVGVGPRTIPDVVYHVWLLALLGWGVWYAMVSTP